MTLNYDFDIFDVIPHEVMQDPDLGAVLSAIGFNPDTSANKVALFRDQQTADALREAPEALQAYFIASGFGLNTYSSGAPRGRYPVLDEGARLAIIHRLTENAETHVLPKPGDFPEGGNGFRLGEFLVDLAAARPITMELPTAEDPVAQDRGRATVKIPVLPPTFDTAPPEVQVIKKKFWQNRFFLVSIALGAVALVLQLTASMGLTILASL